MDRDRVWRAVDDERSSLADLLEQLGPREWEMPSLCAGWRVRDVAAHLTLAQMSSASAAMALLRARGSFGRMIHDTAVAQAARPPHEYPGVLRAMVGSRRKAPGITDLEPLVDLLVHGQDIAIPLGRERPMPTQAAIAAATRVWSMGWPFHAARRLRGVRFVATDAQWLAGGGAQVEGPLRAILLVLTGRPAGVTALSGPGTAELARRYARPASWLSSRPPDPHRA